MFDFIFFLSTKVATTEVFFGLLLLLAFIFWRDGMRREALYVLFGTVILTIAVASLKILFAVPRPVDALIILDTYAFPSGHAAGVVFLSFVLYRYFTKHKNISKLPIFVGLALLVLLVGWSRLFLGVHTIPQLTAGYGLGLCAVGLYLFALKYFPRRK